MSLVARSLARSSTARPRSTNARSITGSSKNVGHPSLGSATAAADMPNDASAPSDTSVFMFGPPLRSARHPSASVSRPGPSSANTLRPACTGVLHSTLSQGTAWWNMCAAWPMRHVAASAQATTTRLVDSSMRRRRSSRLLAAASDALTPATATPHASRTVVGKPFSVTTAARPSPTARTARAMSLSETPPPPLIASAPFPA